MVLKMTEAPTAAPQSIPGTKEIAAAIFNALDKGYFLPSPGKALHLPIATDDAMASLPWPRISLDGGTLVAQFSFVLGEGSEAVTLPIRLRINSKSLQVSICGVTVWQQSLSIAQMIWDSVRSFVGKGNTPLTSRLPIPNTPYSTNINLAQTGYSLTYDRERKILRLEFPTPRPKVGEGTWLWAEAVALVCTPTGGSFEIERKILRIDFAKDPTFVWGA